MKTIFGIQWPFDFWFIQLVPSFFLTMILLISHNNLRNFPLFFFFSWKILSLNYSEYTLFYWSITSYIINYIINFKGTLKSSKTILGWLGFNGLFFFLLFLILWNKSQAVINLNQKIFSSAANTSNPTNPHASFLSPSQAKQIIVLLLFVPYT